MTRKHRRHMDADGARILAAVEREGLLTPMTTKKFGISMLTFRNSRTRASTTSASTDTPPQAHSSLVLGVRPQVQTKVRELLLEMARVGVTCALTVKD